MFARKRSRQAASAALLYPARCWLVVLAACSPAEPAPVLIQRGALTLAAERAFDTDTQTSRPTWGSQVGARLGSGEAGMLAVWYDDRQDARDSVSCLSQRLELDGSVVGLTQLALPQLQAQCPSPRDLVRAPGRWLLSSAEGRLVELDDVGVARRLSSTGVAQRLAVGGNATLATRVDSSGSVEVLRATLWPHDGGAPDAGFVLVSGGLMGGGNHVIAASASQFLLAFQRANDAGTGDLYGLRVPLDGGAGAPFPLVVGPGKETPSAIASDGTDFIVTYELELLPSDGGRERTAGFQWVFADGSTSPGLSLGVTGQLVEPRVCFDGTRYVFVFRELIDLVSETRSRLYALSMAATSGAPSPPVMFYDKWVFGTQLSCGLDGRAMALWSEWNYVTVSNASILLQPLSAGVPAGSPSPLSFAGEAQSVRSSSADWVTFATPRGLFAAPSDGRPDASVPLPEFTRLAGRPGDQHLWLFESPTFEAERRDLSGTFLGRSLLPVRSRSHVPTDLVPVGPDWAVAWADNGDVQLARISRAGGVSTELVLSGAGEAEQLALAVNAAGHALVVWQDSRAGLVRWARSAGGAGGQGASAYYSHPAVGALGDRFIAVWRRNSIVGSWIEADGSLAGDGGLVAFGAPGEEAMPTLACGPAECLLTWMHSNASWDIYGRKIFSDGTLGPVLVLLDGPQSEINPQPHYVGPGEWRLAFDRFVPALATRRTYFVDLFDEFDGGLSFDGGTDLLDGGTGSLDGGAGSSVDYAVGCGCGSRDAPGVWLVFAAAYWLRRRARKSKRSPLGLSGVADSRLPARPKP